MPVMHVAITCSDDYVRRREPHRDEHIARLVGLRAAGALVGAGPAPDGRTVDLFYRVDHAGALPPLIEDDPYRKAGAWTAYASRAFAEFVEPWEVPPVVLDGSRRVTIVEGGATDRDMAAFALIELRGRGRLAFGGLFADGGTLAVVRSADPAEATGWLAESGVWPATLLSARSLFHVL